MLTRDVVEKALERGMDPAGSYPYDVEEIDLTEVVRSCFPEYPRYHLTKHGLGKDRARVIETGPGLKLSPRSPHIDMNAVRRAVRFVDLWKPTKEARGTAYALKHMAEAPFQQQAGYIGAGEAALACILRGVLVRARTGEDGEPWILVALPKIALVSNESHNPARDRHVSPDKVKEFQDWARSEHDANVLRRMITSLE